MCPRHRNCPFPKCVAHVSEHLLHMGPVRTEETVGVGTCLTPGRAWRRDYSLCARFGDGFLLAAVIGARPLFVIANEGFEDGQR